MSDYVMDAVLTLGLSLPVILGEVAFRAKAGFVSCLSFGTLLYGGVCVVGNVFGALLAIPILSKALPNSPLVPIACAFVGVFSFEGILSNTNITIFRAGVLNFDKWIYRARDYAVSAAISSQAQRKLNDETRIAEQLRVLPDQDLNTYVEQYLGKGTAKKLDDSAKMANADPLLYKALAFAAASPKSARAFLKARKKPLEK